jgi:hypothetical protein
MKTLLLIAAIAIVVTPAFADDTIYEIQDGTIPAGTMVTVENVIVTSDAYDFTTAGAYCFVQEPAGGPWSGVQVYWGSGNAGTYDYVQVGDMVNLTGSVEEYYDMTEIDISVTGGSMTLVSTGNCCTIDQVTTAGMMDEQWEGCLIKTGCCEVWELYDYGEWGVNDGTGIGRCDDKGQITYTPAVYDWRILCGILWYSYGDYKLTPRDDGDIVDPGGPTATDDTNWGSIKGLFR